LPLPPRQPHDALLAAATDAVPRAPRPSSSTVRLRLRLPARGAALAECVRVVVSATVVADVIVSRGNDDVNGVPRHTRWHSLHDRDVGFAVVQCSRRVGLAAAAAGGDTPDDSSNGDEDDDDDDDGDGRGTTTVPAPFAEVATALGVPAVRCANDESVTAALG